MNTRCGMFALLLLIASAPAAAADEPYVTIPSGMTQTLVLQNDGSYSTRLGIIARDGGPTASQLEFKKFEVQFKDGRADELFGRFDVIPELRTDGQSDALRITAKAGPAELLPGNYVVVVRVAPRTGDGKPETLAFTLSRPAASMSTGAAVHIERMERLRGEVQVVPGRIRLNEDSRAANLSGLAFSWDLDVKPDAPSASGKLVLPPSPFSLGAGQSQTYPVKLEGDFPPGKYTGKIAVRSPQLTSPVTVTFDLVSRRSPFWLIAIGFVGSVAGWVVRVYLKGKKEAADASIGASLAVQKLALAYNRIEEESVREKIAEQIAAVNEKHASGIATDITAAATAALTALQAIETDFKTDRTNFQPRIDELNKLRAHNWTLPPSLDEGLANIITAHEKVIATFRRNNLTEAGKQADDLIRGPLLSTAIACMSWRRQFADYLAALDAAHLPLGPDARKKLTAAVVGVQSQLPQDLHPTNVDVNKTVTELTATHGAFQGGKEFMTELGNGLAAFLALSQIKLAAVGPAHSSVWSAIEQKTSALQERLKLSLEGPFDASAAEVGGRLSALVSEWRTLFSSQITDKESRKTVEVLLDAGSWDEAISTAEDILDTHDQHEAVVDIEPVVQARPAESMHSHDFGQLPQPSFLKVGAGRIILTGGVAERTSLLKSNKGIEFLQTMTVGALFVGGLYLMNADTWIGTYKDMLAIGVLAFGVDLTTDGVLAVLRK